MTRVAVLVTLGMACVIVAGSALLGPRFIIGAVVGVVIERVGTWAEGVYGQREHEQGHR